MASHYDLSAWMGLGTGTVSCPRRQDRGAAQLAALAIAAGAKAGDYEWDGSGDEFVWIAADNSVVPMDAQIVTAFARATAELKKKCIMHAYAMKQNIAAAKDHDDLDAIDVTAGWPAA